MRVEAYRRKNEYSHKESSGSKSTQTLFDAKYILIPIFSLIKRISH